MLWTENGLLFAAQIVRKMWETRSDFRVALCCKVEPAKQHQKSQVVCFISLCDRGKVRIMNGNQLGQIKLNGGICDRRQNYVLFSFFFFFDCFGPAVSPIKNITILLVCFLDHQDYKNTPNLLWWKRTSHGCLCYTMANKVATSFYFSEPSTKNKIKKEAWIMRYQYTSTCFCLQMGVGNAYKHLGNWAQCPWCPRVE